MDEDIATQTADEFFDAVERWLASLSGEMDKMLVRYTESTGEPVSCHSCTQTFPGCCNQKTMIEFFEALLLARHVKRTGLDTAEYRVMLKQLGEEMEGTDRATWFHANHRCIFMTDQGRCSVYAFRPLVCRLYYVASPQENCQPGVRIGIRFINHAAILGHAIQRGMQIHKAIGIKETPMRIVMGTLPRMLLIALEAWDSDDYAALVRAQTWPTKESLEEWTDGRNPFQVKEQLYQIRPSREG